MSSSAHPTDGELRELLDGEGPRARRTVLQAHVTECEECGNRFAALQESRAVAGSLLDLLAPRPVELRVDPVIQRARRFAYLRQALDAVRRMLSRKP
jgi:anti-sigma factor RsiW